jgi:general secretion pathway protein L
MTETLVIRLRAHDEAPASWLIVDENGARSGSVNHGPVADALSVAQGRRVALLLPGADVSLSAPELPVKGGARLALAVPFALEEQLASDVDALHFAVGIREPDSNATPVAVVARVLLDRWLAACRAAGIQPNAAYCESQAVPVTPNVCTLLLDEDTLYVRRPGGVPYALDAQPLASALELALGPAAEPGEHVAFYATPSEYEAHQALIEGLRARTATLQVKLLPDGALPLLAAHLTSMDPINLLQGPYAAASTIGTRLLQWRVPAALAAATALVFIVGQGLSLWKIKSAEKQVDAQIAQVFGQALPGQKMINAREQIEGVLKRSGGGNAALLPAVSLLAQAVARTPTAHVEALTFRGDAVELRLVAPTVEAIDGIKQAMSRDGVHVELQSATPRGAVVEGRLQVKLGAA